MPVEGGLALNTMRVHDQSIAYLDEGLGSPVLFARCPNTAHDEWGALVALMRRRYRVLAPDLIGYGKTSRWPEGKPMDFEADVRVIVSLARLADAPVHLAGHSYGAAIVLEAARLLGGQVKSLTLIEPVSFQLLRGSGREVEWGQVEALARQMSLELAHGRKQDAAAIYMGFWWGRMHRWLAPRRAKEAVCASIGKLCEEFDRLQHASSRTDNYRLISAPARLIIGRRTKAPARAVVDVLGTALPRAHVKEIGRAGHMSPFTHAKQVNRLVIEHIEACEGE